MSSTDSGGSEDKMKPPLSTSRLKRPMAVSRIANSIQDKSAATSKTAGVKKDDETAMKSTKIVKNKRRSVCRARVVNISAAKKSAIKSVTGSTSTNRKFATAKATLPKIKEPSTSSETVSSEMASSREVKKRKRPQWDIKGRLQDVTEELEEHKKKTKILDDITRRLEALEGEKQAIQVKSSDQDGEIRTLNDKITKLTIENDELSRKQRMLSLELEQVQTDKLKVCHERDKLDLELSIANKKAVEMQINLDEVKTKCASLEDKNNTFREEIRQKDTIIADQETDIKAYETERKQLLNDIIELKGNIRVFCRVRPPIKEESDPDHITFDGQKGKAINITNGDKTANYTFDKVFPPDATQSQVFEELSQLVQSSLDGYNVCVFAYGQTGSGKTYTMEGPDDMSEDTCGVIPRAMKQIFEKSEEQVKMGWKYEFHVEHLEIYCESIQDLLRPKNESAKKLDIRTTKPNGQSGIWVQDLTSHHVECYGDVKKLLTISKRRRSTAATTQNDYSSRSHAVFILRISAKNSSTGQHTESALNLIDLAGSERCGSNGAKGIRFTEGTRINSSLTTLSTVISALAKKDSHIPYRSSKLTLLLSESLGGNSKTLMVVNISPSITSSSESVNTLRFATTVNQCNIGTAQKTVKL